jgi:hypothetical protein
MQVLQFCWMQGKPINLQPADESRSKHTQKRKDLSVVVLVLSLIEVVFEVAIASL